MDSYANGDREQRDDQGAVCEAASIEQHEARHEGPRRRASDVRGVDQRDSAARGLRRARAEVGQDREDEPHEVRHDTHEQIRDGDTEPAAYDHAGRKQRERQEVDRPGDHEPVAERPKHAFGAALTDLLCLPGARRDADEEDAEQLPKYLRGALRGIGHWPYPNDLLAQRDEPREKREKEHRPTWSALARRDVPRNVLDGLDGRPRPETYRDPVDRYRDEHVERHGDEDRGLAPQQDEEDVNRNQRRDRGAERVQRVQTPKRSTDVRVVAREVLDQQRKRRPHEQHGHEEHREHGGRDAGHGEPERAGAHPLHQWNAHRSEGPDAELARSEQQRQVIREPTRERTAEERAEAEAEHEDGHDHRDRLDVDSVDGEEDALPHDLVDERRHAGE